MHLARRVEAAAGCCLHVLAALGIGGANDSGGRDGSPGASSSGSHSASCQGNATAEDSRTAHAGGSGDGNDCQGGQLTATAQGAKGAGSNAAAPAAADVGSSHRAGGGGMGTAPLDWRCPLEVATADGASIRVEHPRQLLNKPANLRSACAHPARPHSATAFGAWRMYMFYIVMHVDGAPACRHSSGTTASVI